MDEIRKRVGRDLVMRYQVFRGYGGGLPSGCSGGGHGNLSWLLRPDTYRRPLSRGTSGRCIEFADTLPLLTSAYPYPRLRIAVVWRLR